MERFDSAVQEHGVVVSHAGHRNVAIRLSQDMPHLGVAQGDLMGVDVDGELYVGALLAVSFDGGVFLAHCHLWRGDFCFWFRGQRYPVTRATWGNRLAPAVIGSVFASGRVL